MTKFALYATEPTELLPDMQVEARMLTRRHAAAEKRSNGKSWEVDCGWPNTLEVVADVNHIDEGSCDLLYGLVRAIQPDMVLETGTHKGRSTAAISQALEANARRGRLVTLDMEDFGTKNSPALTDHQKELVTFAIGTSPRCLGELKETLSEPIDFAYLDGGHEREVLAAELDFVAENAASECTIVVDNTLDDMWPGVREALDDFEHTGITVSTMCGFDIIVLRA